MNSNDFADIFEQPSVHRNPAPLSASIWAPQPQPSETTWPKTIDTFSRAVEHQQQQRDRGPTINSEPPVRREDVFGPVPATNIGAIGDGRRKTPPEFPDDAHVEQLMRTLNLNSPTPAKKPALSLNLDASPSSPDFSPASATSSLMTPTDLSPSARSFDPSLNGTGKQTSASSPYDVGGPTIPSFLQQPSLLFDHPSPTGRTQALESFISQSQGYVHPFSAQAPMYRSLQPQSQPQQYQAQAHTQAQTQSYGAGGGFAFFEPFGDTTPPGP
ncbi:hypothetical protein H0H93_006430, partial [Arthromyces matolae]